MHIATSHREPIIRWKMLRNLLDCWFFENISDHDVMIPLSEITRNLIKIVIEIKSRPIFMVVLWLNQKKQKHNTVVASFIGLDSRNYLTCIHFLGQSYDLLRLSKLIDDHLIRMQKEARVIKIWLFNRFTFKSLNKLYFTSIRRWPYSQRMHLMCRCAIANVNCSAEY